MTRVMWQWCLAAVAAVSLSVALLSVRTSAVPDTAVTALATLAAVLAVFALPSLGSGVATKLLVVLGAMIMGGNGDFAVVGAVDGLMAVVWLGATAAVLVFPSVDSPAPAGVTGRSRAFPLALAVIACGVLGATFAAGGAGDASQSGDDENSDDAGPGDPLRSSQVLDMTQRPRLTDKPLFTVDTDRATFWRTNVFDEWNGWQWARSNENGFAISPGQAIPLPDIEQPRGRTVAVTQDIELLVGASALPAAPSVASVDVEGDAVVIGGTDVVVPRRLGPGSSYSVDSVVSAPNENELASATNSRLPFDIASPYLDPGPVGERTAALAESFVADASRPWELVGEIEAWMAANTEYSLDSPTSPPGSNVVEDFLFDAQLGWCEQIASSLVVLLRINGVPARLATGYVPADRALLGDRWVARERDAHAWTEVWIEGIGWIPVDPTAEISVADGVPAQRFSVLDIAGLVVAALLIGFALIRVAPWIAARLGSIRRRRARTALSDSLVATSERRLIEVGRRWGMEPSPADSMSTYGSAIAARTGRPEAVSVGELLDEWRYRLDGDPDPLDPDEAARLDRALAELETAVPV